MWVFGEEVSALSLLIPKNSLLLYLWKPFGESRISKEDFPVSACMCTHTCLCLGTYLWKLKETDLLTFSFDLCLPVTPLL